MYNVLFGVAFPRAVLLELGYLVVEGDGLATNSKG